MPLGTVPRVTKKTDAVRKAKINFEQIPLEIVKKIADGEDLKKEGAGTDSVIGGSASRERRTGRRGPAVRD